MEERPSERQPLEAGNQQEAVTFCPLTEGTDFCQSQAGIGSESLETTPGSRIFDCLAGPTWTDDLRAVNNKQAFEGLTCR